ncbi:MAG: hypothetical protein IPM66_24990 [Acidobacteriota bacterium]|nr:MAG: hypothetical protein IPM66_24990 [Acidobacteriota bacterium]
MRGIIFFLIASVAALAVPWLTNGSTSPEETTGFGGWPSSLEGRKLQALPLTVRERQFVEGFPGRVARFTDGRREYIMRWVSRPTRSLHPASDCFRGSGYAVRHAPVVIDQSGHAWGSFEARRGETKLLVRERVYQVSGSGSWTDIPAWFWSAMLGRSNGPWMAVTVAEQRSP